MNTKPKIGAPLLGKEPRQGLSSFVAAPTKRQIVKWTESIKSGRKNPGVVIDRLTQHGKKTKFNPNAQ